VKKKWEFDQPPVDDYPWQLTREDLDPEEQAIYDSTLTRLANPSPEQLRMLCAYAWAACELKEAASTDNQPLATWLRNCMIYARNGLGIASPRFVDLLELLLDCDINAGWPPILLSLDRAWQLPELARPGQTLH